MLLEGNRLEASGTQLRSANGGEGKIYIFRRVFTALQKVRSGCHTPRDLDQLDSEALKALILALMSKSSRIGNSSPHNKRKSFFSASSLLCAMRKSNT